MRHAQAKTITLAPAIEQALRKMSRWRCDAVQFVRDNFGVEPDAWQAEGLKAVEGPGRHYLSLQACAGPGKTALLAWIGWYGLSCWCEAGGHPRGAAVAVNQGNLMANLWPELSKWQQRSQFLTESFTHTAKSITSKQHPKTWWLQARAWPQKANPEEQGRTLSGLHSPVMIALIDESAEIPINVGRTAEQMFATEDLLWGCIVQAGNTTSRDGMLYEAARDGDKWHIIEITGDPDDPDRASRVDIDWARAGIEKYGRDNAWVMAFILGRFPDQAFNSLLTQDQVDGAMRRAPRIDEYDTYPVILGVDVATQGLDRSVIVKRQGCVVELVAELRNITGTEGASHVAHAWRKHNAAACFIDATGGFGSSWIDQLRDHLKFTPTGVLFSERASNPQRYANRRAEMWLEMADWVKRGGALPRVKGLADELTVPRYTFRRDAMLMEDKEQIRQRLGRSPDVADAIGLTFAHPVHSQTQMHHIPGRLEFDRKPSMATMDDHGIGDLF